MAVDDVSDRSYERLTTEHLDRLADLAVEVRESMWERNPHLEAYRPNWLFSALCQGAALHYVDGKNGVRDLDVFNFFAAVPGMKMSQIGLSQRDFGPSILGKSQEDIDLWPHHHGRHVDVLRKIIKCAPGALPEDALAAYFLQPKPGSTPWHLKQKAVIILEPANRRGEILWPKD